MALGHMPARRGRTRKVAHRAASAR
jgi:hypothetical protein